MRTAVARLRPRLVAAMLIAVVAVGDSVPVERGRWQWQPQVIATLTASATSTSTGQSVTWQPVIVQPVAASSCGVVNAQRFDPRLLCPADLGTDWSAIDIPRLLLAGCEPYGRMDAAGLTDGTTVVLELVLDKGSRGAALASRNELIQRPGCRDLGHGVRLSAPTLTTEDARPAVEITEVTPDGSAQTTYVAVGTSLVALWSTGTPATTNRLLKAAIARVVTPRREPRFVDVTSTPPYQCLTPATCAAVDSETGG